MTSLKEDPIVVQIFKLDKNPNHIETLKRKIRIVNARLMLSNYTKLISIILYRFKFEIDVERNIVPPYALGGVLWDKSDILNPIPIMYLTVELYSWSEKDLAFLIIHEILHVLDRHAGRRGTKDGMLWNLACDHVINTRCKNDISNGNNIITVPKSAYFADGITETNTTAEEVYQYLTKHTPQMRRSQNGDSSSCGEGEPGQDGNQQYQEVKSKGKWKEINRDLLDDKEPSQQESDQINDMKETVKVAMDSEPFKSLSKSRGDSTGGLTEYLKSIIEVVLPWDEILDKAIKQNVRTPSENRSWRMPNKRMRVHGIMQPSRSMDNMDKSNLYILADHSASVSKGDLKKMASLIMQSIGFFKQIKIIKHDTRIVEEVEVDISSSTEDINNAISGKGRGGTCHRCVFQAIEDRIQKDNDGPEDIGMVLILTDYESNIESIWDRYKWHKKIPVKIILTRTIHVSPKVDPSPIVLIAKN